MALCAEKDGYIDGKTIECVTSTALVSIRRFVVTPILDNLRRYLSVWKGNR